MGVAREIGTRLVVDGEQQFKRAISDAAKSIKEMGSQLTLATAQYKADGDAMKLMQTRSNVLKQEISQQKEIVKALEGAVKDATQTYGENSRQVEKWQAELNRAQAKLIDLDNELKNNDAGLDKNGKAFESAAKKAGDFGGEIGKLDKTAQGGFLANLKNGISGVTVALGGGIAAAAKLGKEIYDMVSESARWADDVKTTALQTGLTVEDVQRWKAAEPLADVDMNAVMQASARMLNPSAAVSEAMRTLNVPQTLVDLETGAAVPRSTVDMFWDVAEAIHAINDETGKTQDEFAKEIFGKGFRELKPLLDLGREGFEALGQAAEDAGAILKADEIAALGETSDAIDVLGQRTEALKNKVSSGLSPGVQSLVEGFTKDVEGALQFLDTPKGKALLGATSNIIANPSYILNPLNTGAQIDWSAVFSGRAAEGNGTGLPIVNAQEIKGVGSPLDLAGNAVSAAQTLWNMASGFIQAEKEKAEESAPAAMPYGMQTPSTVDLAGAVQNVISGVSQLPQILQDLNSPILGDVEGVADAVQSDVQRGVDMFIAGIDAIKEHGLVGAITAAEDARGAAQEASKAAAEAAAAEARARAEKYAAGYLPTGGDASLSIALQQIAARQLNPVWGTGDLLTSWAQMYQSSFYALEDNPAFEAMYDSLSEETTAAFDAAMEAVLNGENLDPYAMNELIDKVFEEAGDALEKQALLIGENVSQGLADGIDAGIPEAEGAAGRLATAVRDTLKTNLQIQSPSRVMAGLGRFTALGFAEGIDEGITNVQRAVGRMAAATAPRAVAAGAYGYGGTVDSRTYHHSSSLYIDKYNQYSGADVDGLMEAMERETLYELQGRGA